MVPPSNQRRVPDVDADLSNTAMHSGERQRLVSERFLDRV
jgi:hypothetical protein